MKTLRKIFFLEFFFIHKIEQKQDMLEDNIW